MTRVLFGIAAAITILLSGITRASADDTTGSNQNPCAVPNEIGSSIEETDWADLGGCYLSGKC